MLILWNRLIVIGMVCQSPWLMAQESYGSHKDLKLVYDSLKLTLLTDAQQLDLLTTASSKSSQETDKTWKGRLEHALGHYYFNQKSYDQAIRSFSSARTIFTNQTSQQVHPALLAMLGKCHFQRGNYLLAGQSFNDALRANGKSNDAILEDDIRDYLLRIYNLQPSINLDETFFIQSYQIKQKLGDRKGMLRVAQRLTESYQQHQQYEKSLVYADQSIQLAQELKLPEEVIQFQLDKIWLMMLMNKRREAFTFLTSIDDQAVEPSNIHLRSKFETAWGDYHLAMGHEDSAMIHYKKAIPPRVAPHIGQYVYRHQSESYKAIGQYKKALEAKELYIRELNASQLSNALSGIAMMEEQSAKLKLSEEIKYLSAQNLLKDSLIRQEKLLADALAVRSESQYQQLIAQEALGAVTLREVELQKQKIQDEIRLRTLFIGSSLALLLLGAAVFTLYKKQKSKNNIISKQSSENEMLMKEIHHRVKNNLQIISSLLDMQSMSIKDVKASEAIKEGKNRVQSMALIHQNLYKDGHIRSIKIDDYIHHLVVSLFDSYQIEKNKITLLEDIAPIYLDVDTVVPLGLIVNELISNSLKYAFIHRHSGSIAITLREKDDTLFFQVKDNGAGFPPDWSPEVNLSFGYQLVKAFAKKIKARLNTYNEEGAVVQLTISKYKMA